jgi:hypothetical protein
VLFRARRQTPADHLRDVIGFLSLDVRRLDLARRAWLSTRLRAMIPQGWAGVISAVPMSAAALAGLQRDVAQGLRRFVRGDRWILPPHRIAVQQAGGISWHDDDRTTLLHAVAQYALAVPDRLRTCEWCDTVFCAVKRQAYCSAECGQAQRDARKKQKLQEQRQRARRRAQKGRTR